MIKDTFFSTPRFVSLCRKELVENWKSNVLRVILLYGVMAVVMVWNAYFEYKSTSPRSEDPTWSFLLVFFLWALWGFGCLSASFTMEKMKSKTSRLSTLMLPATSFEKFFSRWLIYTVLFLIAFLITYKMADYTRVLIYSWVYPQREYIASVDLSHLLGNGDYYSVFRHPLELSAMIAGYFFVQSCFVLGSSIWPKNSFLKTFAAGTVITIIYVSVGTFLTNVALVDRMKEPVFEHFASQELVSTLLIIFCILFALVNWVLAYYRFKESEIINRM